MSDILNTSRYTWTSEGANRTIRFKVLLFFLWTAC